MRFFTTTLLAASLASCGQSDADQMAKTIADSVETGADATKAGLPHGLALYPGARIKIAMLGGSMVTIETEASEEQLTAFYQDQLLSQGYNVEALNKPDSKLKLIGRHEDSPNEELTISVIQDPDALDQFSITFLMLT